MPTQNLKNDLKADWKKMDGLNLEGSKEAPFALSSPDGAQRGKK